MCYNTPLNYSNYTCLNKNFKVQILLLVGYMCVFLATDPAAHWAPCHAWQWLSAIAGDQEMSCFPRSDSSTSHLQGQNPGHIEKLSKHESACPAADSKLLLQADRHRGTWAGCSRYLDLALGLSQLPALAKAAFPRARGAANPGDLPGPSR